MGVLIAIIQLVGVVALVVGVCLIYLPAGIIVAGVVLFAYGLLLEARLPAEVEPVEE